VEVAGTLVLTFAPNAVNNADDPAISFSTGRAIRSIHIPGGSDAGRLPSAGLGVQTGTTAGHDHADGDADGRWSAAGVQLHVDSDHRDPADCAVHLERTRYAYGNGFSLVITGFTTTRRLRKACFASPAVRRCRPRK
jgi:hypothetical protein